MAAQLAGLLDKGHCLIEGVIPGPGTKWALPIDVFVFGPPGGRQRVAAGLARGGFQLAPISESRLATGMSGGAGAGSSASAGAGGSGSGGSLHSVQSMWQRLSSDDVAQEALEADAAVVTTPLLPHQKVALAWLVKRENSGALPPFWEPAVSGNSLLYTNSITNYTMTNRPPPLRGGLLADDMGLGKTLAIISLVATNRAGAVLPPTTTVQQGGAAAAPVVGLPGGGDDAGPQAKRQKTTAVASGSGGGLIKAAQDKAAARAAKMAAEAEPAASPPAADGPRATLVICPTSVLANWSGQVEQHTAPGALRLHVYHGPERNRSRAFLASQVRGFAPAVAVAVLLLGLLLGLRVVLLLVVALVRLGVSPPQAQGVSIRTASSQPARQASNTHCT